MRIKVDNYVWWPHPKLDGVMWVGADSQKVDEPNGINRRVFSFDNHTKRTEDLGLIGKTVHLTPLEMGKLVSQGGKGIVQSCRWCGFNRVGQAVYCPNCGREWKE